MEVDNFKIKLNITDDDKAFYVDYFIKKSNVSKKLKIRKIFEAVVFSIIVLLYFIMVPVHVYNDFFSKYVVNEDVIIAVITLIVVKIIFTLISVRRNEDDIREIFKENKFNEFEANLGIYEFYNEISEYILDINSKGIRVETSFFKVDTMWKDITNVAEFQKYLYLFHHNKLCVMIPLEQCNSKMVLELVRRYGNKKLKELK